MPNDGHDTQFGYFLSPDAADAQAGRGPRERVAAGREEVSRA